MSVVKFLYSVTRELVDYNATKEIHCHDAMLHQRADCVSVVMTCDVALQPSPMLTGLMPGAGHAPVCTVRL
jgi:hypothetical protein